MSISSVSTAYVYGYRYYYGSEIFACQKTD